MMLYTSRSSGEREKSKRRKAIQPATQPTCQETCQQPKQQASRQPAISFVGIRLLEFSVRISTVDIRH